MNKYIKILPVLAIVAAASAVLAFDAPETPTNTLDNVQAKWFKYNGGGESNPLNYTEITSPDPIGQICPLVDGFLCAIEAEDDGTGHPAQADLSDPNTPRRYQDEPEN